MACYSYDRELWRVLDGLLQFWSRAKKTLVHTTIRNISKTSFEYLTYKWGTLFILTMQETSWLHVVDEMTRHPLTWNSSSRITCRSLMWWLTKWRQNWPLLAATLNHHIWFLDQTSLEKVYRLGIQVILLVDLLYKSIVSKLKEYSN